MEYLLQVYLTAPGLFVGTPIDQNLFIDDINVRVNPTSFRTVPEEGYSFVGAMSYHVYDVMSYVVFYFHHIHWKRSKMKYIHNNQLS